MAMMLIRNYIQVKNQPTVVQLSEIEKAGSEWISENFYISESIEGYFKILRHHLAENHGVGIFLVGHYGSGKSHFLAYLVQQLLKGHFGKSIPLPVPLSLLNYRSETPLSEIVEGALHCEIKKTDEMTLQIGLPWGTSPVHMPSVQPKTIELSEELFELAALLEMKDRPLAENLKRRIDQMLFSRQPLFFDKVLLAYEQAVITYTDGYQEPFRLSDRPKKFQDWLSRVAERIHKRRYPQFERYAPTYGPLPTCAYRDLMEFVHENELTKEDCPEYVKVIREAYLVPMGLLQRKGKGYQTPSFAKHDLVNSLMQILPHEPSPQTIYKHFTQPVYGLVPDQIHCLLIFLYLEGELEIVKGNRSYRECFHEIPLPIQYDRLAQGRGLSHDQLLTLEKLCHGLSIETPSRWGALAERRIAGRLKEVACHEKNRLSTFLLKIPGEEFESLRHDLEQLLGYWRALDKETDAIQSLQQFLYEIESAGKFLSLHEKLDGLDERFESLWREAQRFVHLLNHPAVTECDDSGVVTSLARVGSPPSIAEPELLKRWIEEARSCYRKYSEAYRTAHAEFWKAVGERSVWFWRCPRIAGISTLRLTPAIRGIEKLGERTRNDRCPDLSSLEFQPYCRCRFLNGTAPISSHLSDWEKACNEINSELRLYFQRNTVEEKVRQWWQTDPPRDKNDWDAIKRYLEGKCDYPDLGETEILDRHLAGLETYQTVDTEKVLAFFTGKTWEQEGLRRDFSSWLSAFGPRLRFEGLPNEVKEETSPLVPWALRQALETGTPLPKALSKKVQHQIAESLQKEWIRKEGLRKVEELGLGDKATDQIMAWLLSGDLDSIEYSKLSNSKLCRVAGWVRHPPEFKDIDEWIDTVRLAYTHHGRFARILSSNWLSFLEKLVHAPPEIEIADTLTHALKKEQPAQWVCFDGLGLAILSDALEAVAERLTTWELSSVRYARVSTPTDTNRFYHDLTQEGFEHTLEKINSIDELLHSEQSFPDLRTKAKGVLLAALDSLARRLDPSKKILLFSDHGFRLKEDGRGFWHGGTSTLERVVPLVKLVPRKE